VEIGGGYTEFAGSSKTALEGLVSLVVREGYFRLSVASI
jgi:hypothetical protein